jgi:hypothetical protein
MISMLVVFLIIGCSNTSITQKDKEYASLTGIATLPRSLSETSGLARGKASFYTHNDSGNKPRLYQISTSTGEILHEIKVKDTKNHDWEELAEDETHLYIGDFGNNEGLRRNLLIYKVDRHDLKKEEVKAEVIKFSYPARSSLSLTGKHNYDCEAMVAIGDSLYIFSKNRADLATDVYRLPKQEGEYVAQHVGHFNTNGLITAADFLPGESNKLALLGYKIVGSTYQSFFWLFTDFKGTHFFSGKQQRMEISPNLQAEAILFESDTTLIITNEEERGGLGKMNRISIGK